MTIGKADKELIRELADILKETDLTEIEYSIDGAKIRVARGGGAFFSPNFAPSLVADAKPSPALNPASEAKAHPGALKSPMVGTAYLSSEPGAPPFVRVGDAIAVGQNLLIIEAMKVMNPIKATNSGVVKQILVRDGEPVEFDTPLLIIE